MGIRPYDVACIQNSTRVVVEPQSRDTIVRENLERLTELIDWTVNRTDGGVRLVVTPEYGLFGTHRPRTVEEWLEIAVEIPNEYTDILSKKAREHRIFLVAHFMEKDREWPGRVFNTALIFDPIGNIVLKYRKHNGPNNLNTLYTAPGDVYTEYIDRYGMDSLFPVADTEIGRLACFTCYDLTFPEIARCLTLNGAEILIHVTAEPQPIAKTWRHLKIARAYENMAYVVSADSGPWRGANWPGEWANGASLIVSYDGTVLAESMGPGESVTQARIDVSALRQLRVEAQPHTVNPFSQLRAQLYAQVYAHAHAWPNDALAKTPIQTVNETRQIGKEILQKWIDSGILGSE